MIPPLPLACVALALAAGVTAGRNARAEDRPAPVQAAECDTTDLLAGRRPYADADVRGNVALVTDGTVAPEGAPWDAPAAVKLVSRAASITYDLGQPRKLSALYLQADANDTYKIAGSSDGQPGSYRVLAQIANVVERGHGLRARAVRIEPATVRYLRISDPDGDGFFSVSELAAYCLAPTPFPPIMSTVAAPAAVAPRAPEKPTAEQPAPSHIGWIEIVLGAGIVLLDRTGHRPTPPGHAVRIERRARTALSLCPAAVRGQRMRGADLRDRLVPDVAARARVVGGLHRGAAGNLHGRDVPGQPGACALRFAPAAPLAGLRHPRNRHRRLRNSDVGRDSAGRGGLHRGGRAWHSGAAPARLVCGHLPAATDGDDGGHAARGFALGGNEPARRLVARNLLRRQHARGGVRLSARGLLPAPGSRHAHRDLRCRRPERGGGRRRVGTRARPHRDRAQRSRPGACGAFRSDATRLDRSISPSGCQG